MNRVERLLTYLPDLPGHRLNNDWIVAGVGRSQPSGIPIVMIELEAGERRTLFRLPGLLLFAYSMQEYDLEPALMQLERQTWAKREPLHRRLLSLALPPDVASYVLRAV